MMRHLLTLSMLLFAAPAFGQTVTIRTAEGFPPHTFASFMDGKTTFTISWVKTSDRPCLFFAGCGKNLTLEETLAREHGFHSPVVTHDPVKISQATFDRAKAEWDRLQKGGCYRAVGRHNCIGEVRQALGLRGLLIGEPAAYVLVKRLESR